VGGVTFWEVRGKPFLLRGEEEPIRKGEGAKNLSPKPDKGIPRIECGGSGIFQGKKVNWDAAREGEPNANGRYRKVLYGGGVIVGKKKEQGKLPPLETIPTEHGQA